MRGTPGFRFRSIRDLLETRLFRNSKPSALTRLRPTARKAHNVIKEAPPNSAAKPILLGGPIHAESTHLCHHCSWCRRGAGDARPQGGRPGRSTHDRRCADSFVEGGVRRLRWVPGLQPQLPEPFTIERAMSMMDE